MAPSYALAFALAPRVCHAFVSTLCRLTGQALRDALIMFTTSLRLLTMPAFSQVLLAPPYALAFALAPRVCHAFVSTLSGLTGEALSDALVDLDAGKAPAWDVQSLPAPVLAYWGLPEGASMRSVLLVMRADVNARMIINQGADFKTLSLVRHILGHRVSHPCCVQRTPYTSGNCLCLQAIDCPWCL